MYAEHPERYCPQGFHPVHIGDTFAEGRYSIVNKLGHGSSSTIWLALDGTTNQYVSLKIIAAHRSGSTDVELCILQRLQATYDEHEEGSRHIIHFLDHFIHEGPNGRHQCIVTEVLGPSLNCDFGLFWYYEVLPPDIVRRIIGQITLGLQYLHSRGIAHGDLHQGNILLCLPNDLTHEEVEALYKPPVEYELELNLLSHHRPEYIVASPERQELLKLCFTRSNVKICDFSESYLPNIPFPTHGLASPQIFRPPEAILDELPHATIATDVWALAVLFHSLLSGGSDLFHRGDDRMLQEMVVQIGRLPEPWWSRWANRSKYFDDRGVLLHTTSELEPFVKLRSRWMPDENECAAFERLLRSMVRYDPEERSTLAQVVESEWIQRWCRPHMKETRTFTVEFCDD